jgi:hypothetical protein
VGAGTLNLEFVVVVLAAAGWDMNTMVSVGTAPQEALGTLATLLQEGTGKPLHSWDHTHLLVDMEVHMPDFVLAIVLGCS